MNPYELVPENLKSLVYNRKLYDVIKISVELGVFSKMSSPVTPVSLSGDIGTDETFILHLLDALTMAGYMETIEKDGIAYFRNTPISELYLNKDSAWYVGNDIFGGLETYDALRKYVDKGADDTNITTSYWTPELLKNIGAFALLGYVQDTVAHVDLSGREKMLDIGGGHGLFSIFFTKKYPMLKSWVFDLPNVIEAARENIKKFDAAGQVSVIPGDFLDLKRGDIYDVVFISNVTASYDELCSLISSARSLLSPGGMLILRNYVSDGGLDDWSPLIVLDRYSRRGKKGFSMLQLRSAMEKSGLAGVRCLYEGDGIVILSGVK